MAYYISFIKTLSLKLNKHTIHFFYNEVSSWKYQMCVHCSVGLLLFCGIGLYCKLAQRAVLWAVVYKQGKQFWKIDQGRIQVFWKGMAWQWQSDFVASKAKRKCIVFLWQKGGSMRLLHPPGSAPLNCHIQCFANLAAVFESVAANFLFDVVCGLFYMYVAIGW